MRIFGNSKYKGYVILKDKNGNKSKHFITAVDVDPFAKKNNVILSVSGSKGDISLNYDLNTNKKVDIAIKTWARERKKDKKKIGNHFSWFYDFLKRKV